MTDQRKKLQPVVIFLFLSFLFHIGFGVSLYEVPERASKTEDKVEVSYITPQDAARLRHLQQIVEQKNRLNDEHDDKAKYLGAFNQKVEHETRAANAGKFNNTVAGGGAEQGEKQSEHTQKHGKKHALARGELPSLQDLTPQFSPTPSVQPAQPAAPPGQVAQTDDYLKDVKTGLQTMLSTREFVYFSYYSRIKEQLAQYWEPNVREKVKIIYRQGRSIASAHDRVTQLMITLDKNGQLLKIDVLGQSGVHDLDDAAMEAFRAAAPFPNPPKGMVEKDGTIKIRWDFVLES